MNPVRPLVSYGVNMGFNAPLALLETFSNGVYLFDYVEIDLRRFFSILILIY